MKIVKAGNTSTLVLDASDMARMLDVSEIAKVLRECEESAMEIMCIYMPQPDKLYGITVSMGPVKESLVSIDDTEDR